MKPELDLWPPHTHTQVYTPTNINTYTSRKKF